MLIPQKESDVKRIIDGMSSQEIVDGLLSAHDGYKIVKIEDYIHQICKPAPRCSWWDDVSAKNPVLCLVGDSLEELAERKTDLIHRIDANQCYPHVGRDADWEYARPIDPNECWKPPAKPE